MFCKCRPATGCARVSSWWPRTTYGKTNAWTLAKNNEKSECATQRMKYEWKFKLLLLFAIIRMSLSMSSEASSCVCWQTNACDVHIHTRLCVYATMSVCVCARQASSINQLDYYVVVVAAAAWCRERVYDVYLVSTSLCFPVATNFFLSVNKSEMRSRNSKTPKTFWDA